MSEQPASYRRILSSTSVIGGATFVTILIGLVKMKAFALLLGPAGVGLFGVYGVFLALVSAFATMGLNSSGVRELAARTGDPQAMDEARWSLWLLTFALAAGGAILILILQEPITSMTGGGGAPFWAIGWIAACVAMAVIQSSQMVVLQAYQQVASVAKVAVYGAVIASLAGVAAVGAFGSAGVLPALVAVPAAGIVAAFLHSRHLPRLTRRPPSVPVLLNHWNILIKLGLAFVVTVLMHRAVEFAIRAMILDGEGLEAAGLFQAASTISGNNVGLVLSALAADYFPRLSALGNDRVAAEQLVNQQVRVMLLISGPLLVAVVAGAPLALHILYSSQFVAGSSLLQLQAAGDAFKLMSWALGYVMVARGDAVRYVFIEGSLGAVFLTLAALLSPSLGLEGYGVAWVCANLVHTSLLAWACAKRHGIQVSGANSRLLVSYVLTAFLLIGVGSYSWFAAMAVGGLAAAGFGLFSLKQLTLLSGSGQGAILDRIKGVFGR